MTTAHICDGGPKKWGFQLREKGGRKWEYHAARNERHARRQLFNVMALNPRYTQGCVVFSQEYYDPERTITVMVTCG